MKEKGSNKKGFKHQNRKTSRFIDGRNGKGKPANMPNKVRLEYSGVEADEEDDESVMDYRIR